MCTKKMFNVWIIVQMVIVIIVPYEVRIAANFFFIFMLQCNNKAIPRTSLNAHKQAIFVVVVVAVFECAIYYYCLCM